MNLEEFEEEPARTWCTKLEGRFLCGYRSLDIEVNPPNYLLQA